MLRPRAMTLLVGESNDRDSFAVDGDVGLLINESFDRGGDSAHLGVGELKLALHALTKTTAKNHKGAGSGLRRSRIASIRRAASIIVHSL